MKEHIGFQRKTYILNEFAYNNEAKVSSNLPKKNKLAVILSTMHMTGEVENAQACKPKIIKYYNKTKGGVDIMNKMLVVYIYKR